MIRIAALTVSLLTVSTIANAGLSGTVSNVRLRAAQKLVSVYTGNDYSNIDERLPEAVATLAGCYVGQYFNSHQGIKRISDILAQQIAVRTGASEEKARKSIEFATTKLNVQEKIQSALTDLCNAEALEEKFNNPGVVGFYLGKEFTRNTRVAREILDQLIPQIDTAKDTLLAGDFRGFAEGLMAEGTKLALAINSVGKIDFEDQNAINVRRMLSTYDNYQLSQATATYRRRYDERCEPNSTYKYRKMLRDTRGDIRSLWERMNPIAELIQEITNVALPFDPIALADLISDPNVAITKYDLIVHDHFQHEQQNSRCMGAIRGLELTLRRVRGAVLGLNREVLPSEVKKMLAEGKLSDERYLYAPEFYLKSLATKQK